MTEEYTKFGGRFPIERGDDTGTPVTLEEFAAADVAIEQAYRGKFAPLPDASHGDGAAADRARRRGHIIEGKLRPPNHRPKGDTSVRDLVLAIDVSIAWGG